MQPSAAFGSQSTCRASDWLLSGPISAAMPPLGLPTWTGLMEGARHFFDGATRHMEAQQGLDDDVNHRSHVGGFVDERIVWGRDMNAGRATLALDDAPREHDGGVPRW